MVLFFSKGRNGRKKHQPAKTAIAMSMAVCRLRITNNFVMALLARSTSLTVLKPESLRDRVRDVYREALRRHEE